MADVGGEAGLALDAVLDGVGHVVERADEPVEVGVALGLEPGVEAARGQLAGRVGHPRDAGAAGGGWPTSRRRRRATAATALPSDQRAADDAAGCGRAGASGKTSKYCGVELGDVDADGEVRLAVEDEALPARCRRRARPRRSAAGRSG